MHRTNIMRAKKEPIRARIYPPGFMRAKKKITLRKKGTQPSQTCPDWRIHQNAAPCYLLMFLCNWGVKSSLIRSNPGRPLTPHMTYELMKLASETAPCPASGVICESGPGHLDLLIIRNTRKGAGNLVFPIYNSKPKRTNLNCGPKHEAQKKSREFTPQPCLCHLSLVVEFRQKYRRK
jgi:hypothetical protein